MASLEIWSKESIWCWEAADGGKGVELTTGDIPNGSGVAIWFGNRRVSQPHSNLPCDLMRAIDATGRADGWTAVFLNGRQIWASEAARAVDELVGL